MKIGPVRHPPLSWVRPLVAGWVTYAIGSENWHFKTAKKAETECCENGPFEAPPPPGWGVANFVECLKLGKGEVSSEDVCLLSVL